MASETQSMEQIAQKSDAKLHRKLGTIDLLFLSLGGIIGSGWLFGAYKAANIAGPASIISWVVGGIIILFIALNYSELGTMIPRSGSIVRYGQYSHGNLSGFFFGWAYFLSAVSVPAIEAEAVVTYASAYYPILTTNIQTLGYPIMTLTGTIVAALLMVFFFFLNYFGIKVMGRTNTGMTWWKLLIPSVTVIMLFAVGFNPLNIAGLSYTHAGTTYSGFMPYGLGPTLEAVAVSGIVFSFLGFRQGLDYAGEARNPQKSIPIATIGAVLIGIVLYVLLQTIYLGGIKWDVLGISAGNWAGLKGSVIGNAPFAELAQSAGIVWLTYVLFGDAIVSPGGTLNVYLGTSMRTIYGIGATGYLPRSVIKVNEKRRIPIVPLVASLIIGFVFFLPFPSWYSLVAFITSATVFTYLVGGPALRVLRKQAPELKRPFRLPASKIISPIGFVGASLVVYWSGWPLDLYLLVGVYIGFIVYFFLKALAPKTMTRKFTKKDIKAGIWGPVYAAVLTFMTWIGSTDFYSGFGANFFGMPRNYLPFPYDVIVVMVIAVLFYIWAALSGIKTPEIQTIIDEKSQFLSESEFEKDVS